MGSIAELPGAPAQPWLVKHPSTPAGIVSDTQIISSKRLKTDRRIWIYTPPGYSGSGPPSDLIALLDGRMYIDRLLTQSRSTT
jgi:enterochelin esterase-like enzyme